MTYESPRDELLLGILLVVAAGAVGRYATPIAVASVALGVGAYLAVAVLGIGR